ncbi:Partitioning defective 6-like protein beta [Operophtera brumata]|uniref:Partitioning defective 6-like protein beta n=1 Tax=Operophtera brumata TaxID=104452 RepID=A0A0L7LVB3_OPEBR|nr:Partitioning defective 6-like protein beta [Operophtera brumata]
MSKNKIAARIDSLSVEVKTKFDAEFRRFSLNRTEKLKYEDFKGLIEKLHRLHDVAFLISYTDPRDGDSLEELNGYGTMRPRNIISSILSGTPAKNKGLAISNPHDFRMVSVLCSMLWKSLTDGTSVRVTPNGVERSPGIFISRLVPGGLAESTGLLGVNDEVLEVNGIDVNNKTLDQVSAIIEYPCGSLGDS